MKIIAFEGLDASGKATQTKMLCEALVADGKRVFTTSFPRYNRPIGMLIHQWLTDEVELTEEAAHMLFEADRVDFANFVSQYEDYYDYFVIDRYVLSNLAFGMAKGISQKWLLGLQALVRQPDVTFVLDINSKTSFQRRPDRRDRHETDASLLNRTRAAYEYLASSPELSDRLIYTIDANGSSEEVHEAILDFYRNEFF